MRHLALTGFLSALQKCCKDRQNILLIKFLEKSCQLFCLCLGFGGSEATGLAMWRGGRRPDRASLLAMGRADLRAPQRSAAACCGGP
ncbi:hypothetical protein SGRA_1007 [Saprospira grandis str. Lewin]|uniref:Uncharacterized protein n=1 Tax=Saprospira grandis (strain Lewin) TaxID=984262 RepID=H6L315_SAPGL|nr:hypothetical protein SGRA_1007 [Saprospira grandis str. Lewin]